LIRRPEFIQGAGPPPAAGADELVTQATRLLERAAEKGLVLRLLGGVAFHLQVRRRRTHAPRAYQDLDIVAFGRHSRQLKQVLVELGYVADSRFNAIHGKRRLLFRDEIGRRLDIFLDSFEMCHTLPILERISQDPETVPRAELLMTKLQIHEVNAKDLMDMCALMSAYQVDETDEEINCTRIASLCGRDWGLFQTTAANLTRLKDETLLANFDPPVRSGIIEGVVRLTKAMTEFPKSIHWRLRAIPGQRWRWYEEPEEIR